MKCTFINFNAELSGEGSRVLAAVLKQDGHQVKMLYTPHIGKDPLQVTEESWMRDFGDTEVYLFSFMSPYIQWAVHVTEFVRRVQPKARIVWGGVHPSAMPEDSLRYVDYVGRAECEDALPKLIKAFEQGESPTLVPNFWVRGPDGTIYKNDLAAAEKDLDRYPAPDYELDGKFILHNGRIVPLNEELLAKYHTTYYFGTPTYLSLTDRGCPFVCTYCYNSQLVTTYNSRKIRYRSTEHVVFKELKPLLARYPFFKSVGFSDDDFFHRKLEWLQEFAALYKKEINLPFAAATTPVSCTEDKLAVLIDAGLKVVQIGVQSGSERLNKDIYKRPVSNKRLLEALAVLDKYGKQGKIRINCDFILDNPYENDQDIIESIKLYNQFPDSCDLNLFSLTFYPGTTIYDQALKDKLIGDNYDVFTRAFNIQMSKGHNYLTHVFLLKHVMGKKMGDRMLGMLMSKPLRTLGNMLPRKVLDGVWGKWLFPKVCAMNGRMNI
jgi:anaerobic magnesium-protoporphyrin IX monomethyl ester cyclase